MVCPAAVSDRVQQHCHDTTPVGAGSVLFQEAQQFSLLPQFLFILGSTPHFYEGPVILMKVTRTLWIGCSQTQAIFKIPGARCASFRDTGVPNGSQSLSPLLMGVARRSFYPSHWGPLSPLQGLLKLSSQTAGLKGTRKIERGGGP